jgi:hypothetical protein
MVLKQKCRGVMAHGMTERKNEKTAVGKWCAATVRRIWIVRKAHFYKVSLTLPKVILLLDIAPTSFQECAPRGKTEYMFFPKIVKLDIIRTASQKDRRGSDQPPVEYLDDRNIPKTS